MTNVPVDFEEMMLNEQLWAQLHEALLQNDHAAASAWVTKHLAGKDLSEAGKSELPALLRTAATQNHVEVCIALLEAGAPVDASDNNGDSPLLKAVLGCASDTACLLI